MDSGVGGSWSIQPYNASVVWETLLENEPGNGGIVHEKIHLEIDFFKLSRFVETVSPLFKVHHWSAQVILPSSRCKSQGLTSGFRLLWLALWENVFVTGFLCHGSLNVPIEHHPTIRYMVYNGFLVVCIELGLILPFLWKKWWAWTDWQLLNSQRATFASWLPSGELTFCHGKIHHF